MGELYDSLDEFQQLSREYFLKITKILKEKYCWKCPMRSTSSETFCRDVDAWIRLNQSLEWGIQDELHEQNQSLENLELLRVRFLGKKLNPQKKIKDNNLFFQLEFDIHPIASKGDYLFIKSNPRRVNIGDLVLLPRACPLATYRFLKTTGNNMVPFKICKVSSVFSKKGVKYIQTEDGLEVPLEFLMGLIREIIGPKDLNIRK